MLLYTPPPRQLLLSSYGLNHTHCVILSVSAQAFMRKVVEEAATDSDYVWVHDYHLLVLPSLLRKRFNKIRCGVFLHSPFPSSEIFRTFPKREELLRSMLNADLIGELLGARVLEGAWCSRQARESG